jgi:hypothetical protein
MKTEIRGASLVAFEKIISDIDSAAYDAGIKQGKIDGEEEYKQSLDREFEKSNHDFVVEKFSDCKTLADFTETFNELRNRSYNFM